MTVVQHVVATGRNFPSQGVIRDRAGLDVDASDWEWRLNHLSRRKVLNFRDLISLPSSVFEAVVLHMAERIQLTSVDNAKNAFEALSFLTRAESLTDEVAAGRSISTAFFVELRSLNGLSAWRLHHIRFWYRWCAERCLPLFSRDTADMLDDLVIGGNEKGRAVRTRDPERGAFDEIEFAAIVTKLRALGGEILSRTERALVWLEIAFGRNAFTYALMREEDYRPTPEVGTDRVYHRFNVPQIKQRDEYLRSGFDPKMLNQELGVVVADLIAENARNRVRGGWPDGCALPLFPRSSPQSDLIDGPLHEFAMHLTAAEITKTLSGAMRKLEVVSHRTGEMLNVNTRRFRRTFATRMVEEGASPAQLAIGLGHSDLQNVGVYYETRASQVERLDAALAVTLGPIADAFMGRIIDDKANAVNGDDPAKWIPWFRRKFGEKPQRGDDLGICGSGPCGLFAPISCYTCAKFQPWKNGPHREVLDWLVEERERKQDQGLDPQIFKIHDSTILAVGKVVAACEGGDQ